MSAPHSVPHTRILAGLILGAIAGCAVNVAFVDPGPPAVVPAWLKWVNANVAEPVGTVFLRLLFVTVVPLVFASLAVGVAQIGGLGAVGRVGGKTLVYFLLISAIAATIGLALVNAVQPGRGLPPDTVAELQKTYGGDAAKKKPADFTVLEFVKQVVPNNPVSAAANLEMLGIITFALLVGVGITNLEPAKAEVLKQFLEAVGDLMVFVIQVAMRLAPYGVFCLIFKTTSELGFGLLQLLAGYAGVVIAGLAIQGFVVLPLLVRAFAGIGPREFFTKIRTSMVTAFSTSSSSATLPTNMRVAQTE